MVAIAILTALVIPVAVLVLVVVACATIAVPGLLWMLLDLDNLDV